MTRRRWTQQSVIEAIRARHQARLPLVGVWRDDPALYRAAQTHCGSWHHALLAAELPSQTYRRWSKQRVIEELRVWYAAGYAWDHGLAYAARRYFGSWKQALQAADLEPKRHRKWTKQRVIYAIQDRHVRGLPVDRVERSQRSLVVAGRYYFGSWKHALEAAGLAKQYRVTRPPRNWCRQLVISEIQSLQQQGVLITQIWQADPTLYSAAKHQFGSWRAASIASGFTPTRRRWSRQGILSEIHARHQRGLSLSSRLPANKNLAAAAIRYFGTWHKALQAAGVMRQPPDRTRSRCHANK